ncbi:MAG: GNAT family N-acetyltransferase [Myxococcota bacterium]
MIETRRLRCEPVTQAHAAPMFPLLSDTRIYTHLPGGPPASLDALRRRYRFLRDGVSPDGQERWLNWILVRRIDDCPLGFWQATVRAHDASIAYVLHPDHQGQGFATEAGDAILPYLFDRYPIDALRAEIAIDNQASKRLIARLGFRWSHRDEAEGGDVYQRPRPTMRS